MLLSSSMSMAGVFDHNAEEARWMVHNSNWGYMSSLDSKTQEPSASVSSFSDGAADKSTGRLFFYLMGDDSSSFEAALTMSEAVLDPASYELAQCGSRSGVDAEDPRCAKITLSGEVVQSTGEDVATGKAALFARHPQMKDWPKDHGFTVFEMNIKNIWMISSYGGGATIEPAKYYKAKPIHHPEPEPRVATTTTVPITNVIGKTTDTTVAITTAPPPFNQTAARARWLVYNSLWTAVSTVSIMLDGKPWGNVRSVADGVGSNSSGLPFLYLPTPDPTAVDIRANAQATISFSEAALGERVVNGSICVGSDGPMDAEDPTCARIHLNGKLIPLTNNTTPDIPRAEASLGTRHPNAPWLAEGGAHTGGNYFTIELTSIDFLDMYGGPAELTVADYLAAPSPGSP